MTGFVSHLREAAALLAPFSETHVMGSKKWDGHAYVPVTESDIRPVDTYAAKWWATLTVIADMLCGLPGAVPDCQKAVLKEMLFGGMGSFIDFRINEELCGEPARAANERLETIKLDLFEDFKRL